MCLGILLFSIFILLERHRRLFIMDCYLFSAHMFESNVEDTGTYQLNVLGTLSPATDSEATFKMSPSEIISHNHMTDMSESSQPGVTHITVFYSGF